MLSKFRQDFRKKNSMRPQSSTPSIDPADKEFQEKQDFLEKKDLLEVSFTSKKAHEYSQNFDPDEYNNEIIGKRRLRRKKLLLLQVVWLVCLVLTVLTLVYEVVYIAVIEDEVEF